MKKSSLALAISMMVSGPAFSAAFVNTPEKAGPETIMEMAKANEDFFMMFSQDI